MSTDYTSGIDAIIRPDSNSAQRLTVRPIAPSAVVDPVPMDKIIESFNASIRTKWDGNRAEVPSSAICSGASGKQLLSAIESFEGAGWKVREVRGTSGGFGGRSDPYWVFTK